MKNKKLAAAGLAMSALAWTGLCVAADAEATARQVRSWAAACFVCHGPDGRAPAGSPVPGLAGKPQSYLVEQMLAFRSGKRQATVMAQIASGYSEAQISAIAGWFAAER